MSYESKHKRLCEMGVYPITEQDKLKYPGLSGSDIISMKIKDYLDKSNKPNTPIPKEKPKSLISRVLKLIGFKHKSWLSNYNKLYY